MIGLHFQLIAALSAAPEYIALATQLYGDLNCLFDLRSCKCKHVRIGRSAGTMHIPGIAEAICSTPQNLLVRVQLHHLCNILGDFIQTLVGFLQIISLRRQIPVVETEIIDGQLVHQLKRSVYLSLSNVHGIGSAELLVGGTHTKHVRTVSPHSMPPGQRKLQLLPHGLAAYDLIRVVVLERHGIVGCLSLKGDL